MSLKGLLPHILYAKRTAACIIEGRSREMENEQRTSHEGMRWKRTTEAEIVCEGGREEEERRKDDNALGKSRQNKEIQEKVEMPKEAESRRDRRREKWR